MRRFLSLWRERISSSSSLWFGLAALVVGLASGVGVWLFKYLFDLFRWLAFDVLGSALAPAGAWTIALIPILGGLIVGLVVHFFVGVERHHGVAGIIEAVALAGGRLRYARMPMKAIASAISIGSGAAVGPEDPSVQIGSNLGSMVGQYLHLSDERVRTLVASGAAAGIAAGFNAPIAGVFFALEVVLGQIGGGAFGMVVITAVVSSVFIQAVSGAQPAFAVPTYEFRSPLELPLFLVLGLLAGPISALYIRLLYLAQDLFKKWNVPRWVKPAAAGLGLGIVAIFLPQALGIGYESIEAILNGKDLVLGILLALGLAKLILTPLSIGGGFMGGVFAPSLFIGACLGGAFGLVVDRLFPGMPVDPPAYAMVGMASMLAGAVHAPLTAILLLFELTNDYRIILPLMFAVSISLLTSRALQPESVYLLALKRKGIRLDRGRDVEILESITVDEVMQKEFAVINENASLAHASLLFAQTKRHGMLVVDRHGELAGILTLQDLDKAGNDDAEMTTVKDVCTRNLIVVHPKETIGYALSRMSARDLGRLPVVAQDNPRQLVGILRRSDVIRAYDIALTRRTVDRHRVQEARLDTLSPEAVDVLHVRVEVESACDGQSMNEIPWPEGSLIATIQRGKEVLIPHGDTTLQAGDVLIFVADGEARQEVTELCRYRRS